MFIGEGWPKKDFVPGTVTYDRIGSRRHFGVELEYQGLPDSVYDVEDETVFGAKEDCSVEGGEFDSPILYGDQGLDACDKFCSLATQYGFEAGVGAGYHLHLNMRDETLDGLKRIALGYHYTSKYWLGMVPQHRRCSSYSIPHSYNRRVVLNCQIDSSFRNFANSSRRYSWVNWQAFSRHGTVEIRCHQSTIHAPTVTNWVIAHTRFCDAMSEMGVGRITRILGNKDIDRLKQELRAIIQKPSVSLHMERAYMRNHRDDPNYVPDDDWGTSENW